MIRKLFATLCLLLFAAQAEAATYYASNSGSDSNSCSAAQNISTPKQHLTGTDGAFGCLNPGDTLLIRGGLYDEQLSDYWTKFASPASSWAAPITIRGYPGETAEIKASGEITLVVGTGNYSDTQYVIWDNLKFNGADLSPSTHGVIFSVGSHVKILNSEMINLPDGWVMGVFGGDLQVSNNKMHDSYPLYLKGGGQEICQQNICWGYPIYLEASDGNVIFENNEVYNFPSFGVHLYCSGWPECNPSNNIIRNNVFHDFGSRYWPTPPPGALGPGDPRATAMICTRGTNNQYYNNIVYNGDHGISVGSVCDGALIANNTVYNTDYGIGNDPEQYGGLNTVLKNNIAYDNTYTDFDLGGNETLTYSNNLCSKSNPGCTNVISPNQPETIWVDAGNGDFSLISTSPAVDAGTATMGGAYGQRCFNGAAPDIGAHETISPASAEVGAVNSTTVMITLNNACTGDTLPDTNITGLTVQEDTGGGFVTKTITSATASPYQNQIAVVVQEAFVTGSTARFSYAPGNVTDKALIGGSNNQRLNSITNFPITNTVGGGGGVTFTVVNARVYEHDCGEICAKALSSNVAKSKRINLPVRGKALVRIGIGASGGDPDPISFALWYDKNGGSDVQVPTRSTGNEDLSLCPAPGVANGQATTQQITSGSFAAGQVRTIGTGSPVIDLADNGRTELVYSLCVGPGVSLIDRLTLKMKTSGGAAITNTAQVVAEVRRPGSDGF